LDAVHQPRFIDRSVPYIHATLLDEGIYHCSMSTTYRILHSVGEVGERRDQATRPAHVKPELCATGPRQVFAWDIVRHEALWKPCGDERAPPLACRSTSTKLRAA
jgi:putative transposase